MGRLVKGDWRDEWYDTESTGGAFKREDAGFREQIGEGLRYPPASNRYHLYVSLACPWAHRTLIMRTLKGLEPHISVTVTHPHMLTQGWHYEPPEPLYGFEFHHQLYTRAKSDYSGRVTVPVLWDKQSESIVNNESAEILRLFNSAFNSLTGNHDDYYPQPLRDEIDNINERVYHDINNGVYKAGFATTQQAYEEACLPLFAALDWVDERLAARRYLTGERITEADWRLFTTLVRFDPVYHGHFKCNIRRIQDYPHLSGYLRELYQWPGVAQTVNYEHIKQHYYYSHDTINPTRIVPLGMGQDLRQPHDRAYLPGQN
ncbi:MAG TPA: glutathione S-transferase family protein [Pseudomonas sabulinigri]|uniref:GST C-terminal domain-containing protein n=1 Tax=marine sediment metagenome TaxID=412755 RepID=A0A0F9YI60_9ZZZZ|nr:glutathione S-transferase family protein [Halopseudomonas sabulinigri]HEC50371.1 glutathione S-transferase family protein [Halopseudomonas sabulinigri]|tara:strand:+ start:11544 stop:12494 length:951 start_codon:yes stop_codon:yes gene_type:complete